MSSMRHSPSRVTVIDEDTQSKSLAKSPSLTKILSRASLQVYPNNDQTCRVVHDEQKKLEGNPIGYNKRPKVKVRKQKQVHEKIERMIEILHPDFQKSKKKDPKSVMEQDIDKEIMETPDLDYILNKSQVERYKEKIDPLIYKQLSKLKTLNQIN